MTSPPASDAVSALVARRSTECADRVGALVAHVRSRIETTVREAGLAREPRLVAISKLHPPSAIWAAHRTCGQHHFGENYAQEIEAKSRVLPRSIRWHFVGKLQSNKAKLIANIPNLFLLETLDSVKLATALEKARAASSSVDAGADRLGVYLQINTSGEENKSGLAPLREDGDALEKSDVFKLAVHVITQCPSLHLRGLMTIGSASNSQANKAQLDEIRKDVNASDGQEIAKQARKANPDFDTLHQTRLALVKALRASRDAVKDEAGLYTELLTGEEVNGSLELSMGMSNDLEVAVLAGSDNVRVGTDCFGVRPKSRDEAMEAMKDELEGEEGQKTKDN